MKITEALLAEHVVFHNLFDHIEAILPTTKSVAEIHLLARLLESILNAHSKVEDELIIAPLEHCFAQLGQQEGFHDEHVEIDASLKNALAQRNLKTARKLLLATVIASRNHFDKEERIIFPMAEKILKGESLNALAISWSKQRQAIAG